MLLSRFILVLIALNFFITSNYFVSAKSKKDSTTVYPSEQNFKAGIKAYKSKDYDTAVDAFLQSIYFARNNYQPEAYYYLGLTYVEQNKLDKACEAFKKTIEQSVNPSPDAEVELGKIYLRQNRLDDALSAANHAIIDYGGKDRSRAYNLLGLVFDKMGDYDSAKYNYENALGDRPWTYTHAWENYVANCMARNQIGEAIKNINEIFTSPVPLKDVNFEQLHLMLGLCFLSKGNVQGAIDSWHKVLEYNINNKDAHFQLGLLFDKEKHYSSAIKEYQSFIACAGDDSKVAKVKDRISELNIQIHGEQKLNTPTQSPYLLNNQTSSNLNQQPLNKAPVQAPKELDSGF